MFQAVTKAVARRLRNDRRGAVAVELAVTGPFMLIATFASFYLGINYDRYLTMQQLARAAANMHSRGADFNQAGTKAQLKKAASGLDYGGADADTVVYMTAIAQTDTGPKIVERFRIGKQSIWNSELGMPSTSNTGAVNPPMAVSLPAGVTIPAGQRIYAAEVYHSPDFTGIPWVFDKGYRLRAVSYY